MRGYGPRGLGKFVFLGKSSIIDRIRRWFVIVTEE
jgi:hypothetical protein